MRRFGWDLDFGTWTTDTCQVWSYNNDSPNERYRSPIYSDEHRSKAIHCNKAEKTNQDKTRYSAPYLNLPTIPVLEKEDPPITTEYFVDTGASESTVTSSLLAKLEWTQAAQRTVKCSGLRGLIAVIPVTGEITLALELASPQTKEVKSIEHTFQVIDSDVVEASLGMKFFTENNLVHSASKAAVCGEEEKIWKPYNYPRDITVKDIIVRAAETQTSTESVELLCDFGDEGTQTTSPSNKVPTTNISQILLPTINHFHHTKTSVDAKVAMATTLDCEADSQSQLTTTQPVPNPSQDDAHNPESPALGHPQTNKQEQEPQPNKQDVQTVPIPTVQYPHLAVDAMEQTQSPTTDRQETSSVTMPISLLQTKPQVDLQLEFSPTLTLYNNTLLNILRPEAKITSCHSRNPHNITLWDVNKQISLLQKHPPIPIKFLIAPNTHTGTKNTTPATRASHFTQTYIPQLAITLPSTTPPPTIPEAPHVNTENVPVTARLVKNAATVDHTNTQQGHTVSTQTSTISIPQITDTPTETHQNSHNKGSSHACNNEEDPQKEEVLDDRVIQEIEYQQQMESREENSDEAVPITLPHKLTIRANTAQIVTITMDDKLSPHFGKEMLIEPSLPTVKGQPQLLYISRQLITFKKETQMEVINTHDFPYNLPTGTYMGTWYLSECYTKTPIAFSNNTAKKEAEEQSRAIKERVNKLTDGEVRFQIKTLLDSIPWLRDITTETVPDERTILRILIMCTINQSAFQHTPTDLGRYVNGHFDINMTNKKPVKLKQYKMSDEKSRILQTIMKEYDDIGAIEPSTSIWNSPVLVVTKKRSDKKRGAIDYRALNKQIQDCYVPLKSTDQYFNRIEGAKFYSILDIANAYMNLEINPIHRKYTAFTIGLRKYQCARFSFGLGISGSYWLAVMYAVLGERFEENLLWYVDDCIVFSKTIDKNLEMCDETLRRLSRAGLMAKPGKTQFLVKEIKFLGFLVSEQGIRNDPAKIEPLFQMMAPHDKTTARSFLGMVNYFKDSVPALQIIATPIHEITGKKSQFHWGPQQQKAYNEILIRLSSTPILARFRANEEIQIYTDASLIGGAAWLMQKDQNGDQHLIACFSKKWIPHEGQQKIAHLETLAVVKAVTEWESYLSAASKIKVFTDSTCLKYMLEMRRPTLQQMRWIQLFTAYNIEFHHIPGNQNVLADHLSRAFSIADNYTPGKNHQVSNFPRIKVSPEAVNRWKTETIRRARLVERLQERQSQIHQVKLQHKPTYDPTVQFLMKNKPPKLRTPQEPTTEHVNIMSQAGDDEVSSTPNSPTPEKRATTADFNTVINNSQQNTPGREDLTTTTTSPPPHYRDKRPTSSPQLAAQPPAHITSYSTLQTNPTTLAAENHGHLTTNQIPNPSDDEFPRQNDPAILNSPYTQMSIILTGVPDYAFVIKEQTISCLKTHRELFFNDNEEALSIIRNVTTGRSNHKQELAALATTYLIPISNIKDDRGTVTFPATYTSKAVMAQLGMIIEFQETPEYGFQWLNKSLCREFFPKSLQGIVAEPHEIFVITGEELLSSEKYITTLESMKPDVSENKDFQEAANKEVLPLQQSKYRAVTRSEHTHELPEPIGHRKKIAARPRVGTVEIEEKGFPTICVEDIITAQTEDPFCIILKATLLGQPCPYKLKPTEQHKYEAMCDHTEISQQGILINHSKPDEFNNSQARIVCPMSFIQHIFYLAHDSNFHQGIYKSAKHLLDRFWRPPALSTPGLQEMLKSYINSCAICPKRKAVNMNLSQRLKYRIPKVPTGIHQTICLDYLGPFTPAAETTMIDNHPQPTGRIFKYVLVAVDTFSGFVYLKATPRATSGYAVTGILDIIQVQGTVRTIRCDNGRHFDNMFFRQAMKQMGITVAYLLPMAAWGNRAERANLVISDALRVVDTTGTPWYDYLPFIQLVMNATYNKSLRTSPFMIQFGRVPILPSDLITPNPVISPYYGTHRQDPAEHARTLQRKMMDINKRITVRIAQEKFNSHKYRDKAIEQERQIETGDTVMIKLNLKPGVSEKTTSKWIGYFTVIEVHDTKITVQTQGGSTMYNIHANFVIRVQDDFTQDFTLWNEAMIEYSNELKAIEIPQPTHVCIEDYITDQSKPDELISNKPRRPPPPGVRQNAYPKRRSPKTKKLRRCIQCRCKPQTITTPSCKLDDQTHHTTTQDEAATGTTDHNKSGTPTYKVRALQISTRAPQSLAYQLMNVTWHYISYQIHRARKFIQTQSDAIIQKHTQVQ